MKRTILQVPMSQELREKAEKVSENLGFSSLQEVVRILLTKLADGKLEFEVKILK